jgi:hypothetical protein
MTEASLRRIHKARDSDGRTIRGPLQLSRRPKGAVNSIRGYQWFQMAGGKAIKLTNLFAALYPDHPSAFKWRKDGPSADMGALGRFIDAIYFGNTRVLNEAQESGDAFDVEYDPGTNPPLERMHIRLPQLLSLLSLKGEAALPLWGRVSFITDSRNLVPAEMLTHLAAVAPHLFEVPPAGRKWREIKTEGDLWRTLKLRPEQVTASMYRNHGPVGGADGPRPLTPAEIAARDAALAEPEDAPEEAPSFVRAAEDEGLAPPAAETPISRNEGNGYVELVTRVESRPDPHYARRIIARGRVIYSATSWHLDGPWHVWERNVSAMLGLGLA